MDQKTYKKRLSFVKGVSCILEPIMNKADNESLNYHITKTSVPSGDDEFRLNELEKLALILADKYNEKETVSAILELSRK